MVVGSELFIYAPYLSCVEVVPRMRTMTATNIKEDNFFLIGGELIMIGHGDLIFGGQMFGCE